MAAGSNELVIRQDGSVEVLPGTLRGRLALRAGRYRLREGDPQLLILERSDAPARAQGRVLMSGDIVDANTVLEIVNVIAQSSWSGELRVLGTATRSLTIERGALKATTTSVTEERLGEVMVAVGLIDRAELAECLRAQRPPNRLGEVAIDHGHLTQDELFRALATQAERIFRGALGVTEGHYVFTVRNEDTDDAAMTVHLPIQSLLMETVQRIDEMSALRERIPSGDLCPRSLPAAARVSMRHSLIPIALRADGAHSIHEIARELQMDEFEATRRVLQLLQIGAVELTERQELSADAVAPIVRQLNDILREIRDTVARYRGEEQMHWTFQNGLRDTPLERTFGPSLTVSHELSATEITRRLRATGGERPIEALVQAAHELITFVMFAASPILPRDAERALSKWVNQRMGRIAA